MSPVFFKFEKVEMYQPVNFSNLSNEDLQEEYSKLFKHCLDLCKNREADIQRIHELKRSLDTANAAEAYLTQELEQMTISLKSASCNEQSKVELKLQELQSRYSDLLAENSNLQQNCETLRAENAHIRNCLREATINLSQEATKADTEQQRKREQELEKENLELLAQLEECKDINVQQSITIAQHERNIEILREQVKCTEENMRCKRDELEEISALLESTQEQLMEANAKIATLTEETGSNRDKGNSLFAEVDDQRQAMKKLLLAQKSSYMHMKKAFNQGEHEIRRLKRENIAMHTELQACSSIFRDAEKTYQEKLNERIRLLWSEKENLEKKLKWSQDLLKEVATGNGVLWLDSMLNFCKQETLELSKHLQSLRIQEASLEEQIRNCKQEMARWRFESLKLKCVLIDRENRLIENNIHFKPINEMEISINDEPFEARNHLPANNEPPGNKPNFKDVNNAEHFILNPYTAKNNINEQSFCKGAGTKDKPISLTLSSDENKENTPPEHTKKNENKISSPHQGPLKDSPSINIITVPVTEAINKLGISAEKFDLKETKPTVSRNDPDQQYFNSKDPKSILRKEQDIFKEEPTKSVKFSNECHEISSMSNGGDNNNEKKAVVKQIHTKSNIIIKKVILKSKNSS